MRRVRKPRQPAGVDIEPDAANAQIGCGDREGDVEIGAGEPDAAIAIYDVTKC